MPGSSEIEERKLKLNELMKKKNTMEDLIEVFKIQAVYDEKLIDSEGFPRADLDIVAVRTARNRYVCTQNDHKALMKQIDVSLQEYHQAQRDILTKPKFTDSKPTKDWKPFAIVQHVKPVSPAFLANLVESDKIVQFGPITFDSFQNLPQLAALLKSHENKDIVIFVDRQSSGEIVQCTLTPKKWDGVGLLGATINLFH